MKLIYTITAFAVAATSAVSAADFVTSHSTVRGADDNDQATPMFGQSIAVNVGADTADRSIPATVYLRELSFQYTSSYAIKGRAPADVYIHVYDAFAVDGSLSPSLIGNLVAVSTNAVNMATLTGNETLTWNFLGSDAVDKSTAYAYVLATSTTAATVGNSSHLVGAGFELDTGSPYVGGWAFVGNNTRADWDLAFELKTSSQSSKVDIPEPAVMALFCGIGGLALAMLRRR